jgi:hypothetical protein
MSRRSVDQAVPPFWVPLRLLGNQIRTYDPVL